MKVIVIAILQLAASVLWAFGFYSLAKDINEVVVTGTGVAPAKSMFDVFMQIGMFGLLQSIGALRGLYAWWGGSMDTALNTRHFTLWKNSGGDVVAAEEDHAAPIWGCLIMLIVGGFLVVACSALISPIMFIVNVWFALLVLTGWRTGKMSPLGIVLAVIVGVSCIGGTFYGWKYISDRVEILQERDRAAQAERQRQFEAQRAEQMRIAAEKRAEEERIRAEQQAAQKRQQTERKAEQDRQRAERKTNQERRGMERRQAVEAKRVVHQTERAARDASRGQVPANAVKAIMQPTVRQQRGTSPTVQPRQQRCRKCRGSGKTTVEVTCLTCGGRRKIPNPNATLGAVNAVLKGSRNRRVKSPPAEIACPAKCGRNGKIRQQMSCSACGGTGVVR